MIRSGSYKKLLRAYYSKLEKEEGLSTTDKPNKTDKTQQKVAETTTKLKAVSEDATALKDTAMKLAQKGEKSLFEKQTISETDENGVTTTRKDYDYNAIVKTVKSFVENYNDTLDTVSKVDSPALQQKAGWLTANTKLYVDDLKEVGITVDENNRLSVNEETLRATDIDTLSELFEGANSFAGKAAVKANQIGNYAQYQATRTASAYNNNGGMYNSQVSLNSGALFDSLF